MTGDETTRLPAETDRREAERRGNRATFGILLIALGVLMLADQLEIGFQPIGIRINLGDLWPVILLVLGVMKLVTAGAHGRRSSGYWLVFLSAVFLLHTYDVLRLSQSWPLFIVAGGVSMMFGSRDCQRGEA
jgi:hypothetical protein